jgi:hypothetical protein
MVTLINNTIAYNSTTTTYGGIEIKNLATFTGKNNIIYANTAPNNLEIGTLRGVGEIMLTYSCTSKKLTGKGNIFEDPLFVNPGKEDFRLRKKSPCINAGKKQDGKSMNMGAL